MKGEFVLVNPTLPCRSVRLIETGKLPGLSLICKVARATYELLPVLVTDAVSPSINTNGVETASEVVKLTVTWSPEKAVPLLDGGVFPSTKVIELMDAVGGVLSIT